MREPPGDSPTLEAAMAIKISRGKTLPIGVDLGTSAVKLVQLRLMEETTELLAVGCSDIPRPVRNDPPRRLEFLAERIRHALKASPFKGRQCVLSLPARDTFVQHVRVPPQPADRLGDAVASELAGKLPYPLEDAVVRHIAVGEVGGDGETRQEVIVVAAERRAVEGYLDAVRKGGLDVTAVNVEPCAIVQCFARLFRRAADAHRTILFIDIGATSTQAVLSHGSRMVFARNLPLGGEQIDQAVAQGMEIPVEQACAMRRDLVQGEGGADASVVDELYRMLDGTLDGMAEQLAQCARYHESVFHNQPIERAIFVGGQAYDKRLCQSLAQRLNLPAQIGDPLVRIASAGQVGTDRRGPRPDWTVAIGLSLGAAKAA